MKISIITPVYNREDCISRCIESVAIQAEGVEHWIVNDGSTDATLFIVRQFADKYPHIHLLTYECNAGVGAARNAAIQNAPETTSFLWIAMTILLKMRLLLSEQL